MCRRCHQAGHTLKLELTTLTGSRRQREETGARASSSIPWRKVHLGRELKRRSREPVVAKRVLDGSPPRRLARQLLRVEIEGENDLSLRPLRKPGLRIDPVRN